MPHGSFGSALPIRTKLCARCGSACPITDFGVSSFETGKRQANCRPCQVIVEAERQTAERSMPDHNRARRLSRTYDLSRADFAEKLLAQGGKCQICSKVFSAEVRVNVDHDHESGATRGLLCTSCNTRLAVVENSPEWILLAIAYLKSHGSWCAASAKPKAPPANSHEATKNRLAKRGNFF